MKFDTVLPADSVEFCPHPEAQRIFVCGTYQLQIDSSPPEKIPTPEDVSPQPTKQKRLGECLIFKVAEKDDTDFQLVDHFTLPAILDMKWSHAQLEHGPLLAIADAEGQISTHRWNVSEQRLEKLQSIQCASPDVLCLSLDWSNRRNSHDLGSLIVSRSDGFLSLLRQTEDQALTVSDSWYAHDYEPWIAAWNYWDDRIIYSGGDDLKLKGWDIRQGFSQTTFTNTRFNAGVTTIQSHPHVEHLFAVGSYDNSVRLYDARKPLVSLTDVDVGGGAWRVKWHPDSTRKTDLLVACMHDGFKVVQFRSDIFGLREVVPGDDGRSQAPSWEVIKRYDEHGSLAYGVDWSYVGKRESEGTLIASCSFYDHAVHVWHG